MKPGSVIIATSPYGVTDDGEDMWAMLLLNPEPPYYEIVLPPIVPSGDLVYRNIADAGDAWRSYTQ